MTYDLLQPPFTLSFGEMPKQELRRYNDWFIQLIPERLRQLASAVKETSLYENWQPDGEPASLDLLGHWFVTQVSIRPRSEEESKRIQVKTKFRIDVPSEELTAHTYSVAMDVGMYLSQVFLKKHPSLKWHQPVSAKSSIDYGQPVLVKFKPGPFNPVRMVVTFAYGVASQSKKGADLRKIYETWSKLVE